MLTNKNNLRSPPAVMTWGKALPVILVALIFWLLRLMFEMFWFLGPAIIALGCTLEVNSILNTSISAVLGKGVATVCTGVAAVLGVYGASIIETMGVVMAMAVGFMGWLFVGGIILFTNRRIFTEDPMAAVWLTSGLIVSEIPLIGSLPGLLGAVLKLYHKQIKHDKAALKKYNERLAAQKEQAQYEQMTQLAQMRAEQEQAYQGEDAQEAANDARYDEDRSEAENDSSYGNVNDVQEEGEDYAQEYKKAA